MVNALLAMKAEAEKAILFAEAKLAVVDELLEKFSVAEPCKAEAVAPVAVEETAEADEPYVDIGI